MIKIKGTILFEPRNVTKKHLKQSSWKRVAMIILDDDSCNYYSWFIEKRYNLKLNNPLRGSHVTIINDNERSFGDINKWEETKQKYNGKEIEFYIDTDVRTDGKYWWLKVHGDLITNIRTECTLGNPYFGFHLTIGYSNERNIEHSKYIHKLIKKYGKEYN